ncbi:MULTISPECIES: DUF6064 family protein [Arenibacter]|uniref:DUF6064 family protein n=1 Tax=Arenibacter TaxID=178469 RepID=UPI0018646A52|nr:MULTISPECIES: DUF6064 family protein [Arenibacter]
MEIPFTIEEFLNTFKNYNESVFPAQYFTYLLGVIVVVNLFRPSRNSGKIISGILSLFWLWMGIVYHIIYFSTINKVAIVFGIAFIIQGILFLIVGVIADKLKYELELSKIGVSQIIAIVFIIYAMIGYPILNQLFGHSYPYSPIFGLAPCPTVIFTFAVLLLCYQKKSIYLLIIPFLWSIIGFSAAFNLGMIEDYGLVIAGILGLIFILKNKRMISKNKTTKASR